jgi:AcrR family transcriptional regulator
MDVNPTEANGRAGQRARTRATLIRTARNLLADGATPTVAQVAAAAAISRATAYRYFPSQAALLVATYPEIEGTSLLGEQPPADPEARLALVAAALTRQMVEHEPELRTMLRLSLSADGPKRGELPFRVGRRIVWVSDALAPLQGRMPEADLQRLVLAIAAGLGIEALVWLTDIAGLSRQEAEETMQWSARSLLQAALARAV